MPFSNVFASFIFAVILNTLTVTSFVLLETHVNLHINNNLKLQFFAAIQISTILNQLSKKQSILLANT